MTILTKAAAIKGILITAATLGAGSVMAAATGFGNDFSGSTVTVGGMSKNVAGTFGDVASGFEAFLYFLAVVFVVFFILAAWKYKKSDGRDGSMGLIATYLVLAAASIAAPTVLSSVGSTLFGSNATTVRAPTSSTIPNIAN